MILFRVLLCACVLLPTREGLHDRALHEVLSGHPFPFPFLAIFVLLYVCNHGIKIVKIVTKYCTSYKQVHNKFFVLLISMLIFGEFFGSLSCVRKLLDFRSNMQACSAIMSSVLWSVRFSRCLRSACELFVH